MSFISEFSFIFSILSFTFIASYFSILFKNLIFIQLYIPSLFLFPFILIIVYIISNYINIGKQPFEFTECESETVTGVITEFSSYIFMLFSCLELTNF